MKRQTVSLISLLGLLLMAGSAVAQRIQVSVSVPFNFIVGSQKLPAGTYQLRIKVGDLTRAAFFTLQ